MTFMSFLDGEFTTISSRLPGELGRGCRGNSGAIIGGLGLRSDSPMSSCVGEPAPSKTCAVLSELKTQDLFEMLQLDILKDPLDE